jgi:hypothetical protein
MKTIKVNDEMYEALMELSKEINSQDHGYTPMPYIFQIQTTDEVPAHEGFGEEVWIGDDGGGLRTEQEIKEFIHEHIIETDESGLNDEQIEMKAKKQINDMDIYDMKEYLKNIDYKLYNIEKAYELKNAFFTAKACEEHIKYNNYHYNEPRSCISYAFSNPELELVFKFLCGLTGKEMYKL